MIGRKVSTYSRRKPFAQVREEAEGDGSSTEVDVNVDETAASVEAVRRGEDVFARISASIKSMDICGSTLVKSRKSDIRPRLSLAPSALEMSELLGCCHQSDKEVSFSSWLESMRERHPQCEKLGESSFSEVFKFSAADDDCLAVKIMPLMRPGTDPSSIDASKSPEPIQLSNLLHEIQTLQALESLRAERRYAVPTGHTGFNRLWRCELVAGEYPPFLLERWDEWPREFKSHNDRPDFYNEESLHVILVMEFGGVDLEHTMLRSAMQIQSILLQVLASVSLAEKRIRFEHRDLHLGNVLVKETHRDDIRLGSYLTVPTGGILCSIIDCSLARFQREGRAARFRNLAHDEWLFSGDAAESEQYQVYRDMRELVGDNWEGFHPQTNLLWLAHMGRELLERHARLAKREKDRLDLIQDFVKKLPTYKDCQEAFEALLKL